MKRRLATVRPRVQTVAPRLRTITPQQGSSSRFRHLYGTARWQKLRMDVLVEGLFTCVMCGKVSAHRMVCDHVNGHPADETEEQFWAGPFQVLCPDCHEGDKKRADARVRAA